MQQLNPILADGLSPGMIFAIAVAIIVALANVFGKKKQAESMQEKLRKNRQQRETPDRVLTIEQIIQDQMRRAESQQPQRAPKKKQKPRQPERAAPPPIPVVQPARQLAQQQPETLLARPNRLTRSESARNVRLMLQPAGIREAFILSEVLSKPKALRDE
jgi:uncharacterized protein HemX